MSLKKFIFIFLLSSCLFLVSSHAPVHAQLGATATATSTPSKMFSILQDAAKLGKTTVERWSEDFMTSSLMVVQRIFIGPLDVAFLEALDKFNKGEVVSIPKIVPGGSIGKGSEMIATLFTPQASGIEYIAGIKDNLLGKPAYAQGFGFKGLEFLLPLWKMTRNIVYVLSSIIFVVIGLMIIMRVKISPQAVVTIQSAIPQVITTLILVTFSYAIAGLMIDLGNLIAGIIIAMLFNAQGTSLDKSFFSVWQASSGYIGLSDFGQAAQNSINAILDAFNAAPLRFTNLVNPDQKTLSLLAFRTSPHWWSLMLLGGLLGSVMTGIFFGGLGNAVFGGLGLNIATVGGQVVGGAGGAIIGLIIIPIVLCIFISIWLIKLYFGLVKVYVTLIFKIISGPLEIAMGAFPNSKTGFGTWVLEVFANVMVFPIVTIVFLIVNIITDAISGTQALGTVWAPGLINSGNSVNQHILSACVGIAGLALISKLPDLIPQYIFMIKPSPFGQAIGQNIDSMSKDTRKLAGNTIELGMGPIKQATGYDIGGYINKFIN